jgi:hypothetical protein
MNEQICQKIEAIREYPFFQCVGAGLPSTVHAVDNWQEAIVQATSRKWENCRLMARNAFQDTLAKRAWDRTKEWNPLIDEVRPILVQFFDELLLSVSVPTHFRDKLKREMVWDFLGICVESQFKNSVKPLFYVPMIEPWYVAGRFPCGWDGMEFPDNWEGVVRDGRIMVF